MNLLVYAFRADSARHADYRQYLEGLRSGSEPFSSPLPAMAAFLRITTHSRIYSSPSTVEEGERFLAAVRASQNYVPVHPGPRHWEIFVGLCRAIGACGNAIQDAFLAAFAVETGAQWASADRGFSRFPGLKWRHPLDP